MSMLCSKIREQWLDALDGGRMGEEGVAHLETCSACRTWSEEIRENERILRRAKVPEAPLRLWQGIERALSAAGGERMRPRGWGLGWAAGAAAVVLLAFGVAMLSSRPGGAPDFEVVELQGDAAEAFGVLIPRFGEAQVRAGVADTLAMPHVERP